MFLTLIESGELSPLKNSILIDREKNIFDEDFSFGKSEELNQVKTRFINISR